MHLALGRCQADEEKNMLALSVRFPEVALIAQGIKTIEVRRWRTRHRGELLIVSSKLPAAEALSPLYARVPSGAAICVVDLLDCRPMRPSDAEAAMCDSAPACTPGASSYAFGPRPCRSKDSPSCTKLTTI